MKRMSQVTIKVSYMYMSSISKHWVVFYCQHNLTKVRFTV